MDKRLLEEKLFYLRSVTMSGGASCLVGKTPKELLEYCGMQNDTLIDLNKLVEKLGIVVAPVNFTDLENSSEEMKVMVKERGNILGMVVKLKNDLVGILYDEKSTPHRKRFTVAHEIAHCCLNQVSEEESYIEFRLDHDNEDEKEIAANTFAGELLIPEDKIRDLCSNLIFVDVLELADTFAVSANVMKERLKSLKIDYI